MLFLLFCSINAFNLREPFKTAWNVEVVDPSLKGETLKTFFYYFNLTSQDDPNIFSANIYEGNYSESSSEETEPISSFELKMEDDQEGLIEVDGKLVTEFKFVDSFPNYLAAYGTYNDTYSYTVNIINLAIIHISLYSFDKKLFRELVLTRYKPENEVIPWYAKYSNYIVTAVVFVISFALLHLTDYIKKRLKPKESEDKKETKSEDEKVQKGKQKED